MEKTLNKNIILTVIKTIVSMLFPLITFPYVTRVLSAEGIGEYNYANSIINYFLLIASLGIGSYAVREGAKKKEDRASMSEFASEMLTLNLFFGLISYLLLGLCFLFSQEFRDYGPAISIFSISIFFSVIGVEWVFSIYEDYYYITIRSILFQILSAVFLFVFVRTEADVYWYIGINVFSSVGSNVFNWLYAKKYVDFKLVLKKKIFRHVKAVVMIFAITLATIIYVNADKTMLGAMKGTIEVGYYTVASKMYHIIKCVLNAIVPVFMVRLAYSFNTDKEEYRKTYQYANDILLLVTIPIAVGSLFFSRDIILLLSGEEYLAAEPGMKILFFSMIFATAANLLGSGGLILDQKEKYMFLATVSGAVINLVINYILIPEWGCTGAAFATLLTEVGVFTILFISYKKYIKAKIGYSHLLKCLIATTPFFLVNYIREYNNWMSPFGGVGWIAVCAVFYFLVLWALKDELVLSFMKLGLEKIKNIRRV